MGKILEDMDTTKIPLLHVVSSSQDLLILDAEGAHHVIEAKCELIDVLVAKGEQLPIFADPLHYSIDFLVRSM
jgi:hypothetical protein